MTRMPETDLERRRRHQARHRRPLQLSNAQMGIVLVALLVVASFLAFTKHVPFTGHGYTLSATFKNAVNIRSHSPVRIAGVDVGEVLKVEPHGNASKVTFTVDEDGRPVKEDAFASIRPRLFLEGNFFIDLQPGSPSAAELASGSTIPITHTATGVQLDEILSALRAPQRENLGKLLIGYGTALQHEPTPAEDRGHDPAEYGKSGAEALNASFDHGARAAAGSARVLEALQGTEPHDLSRLIESSGRAFGAFADQERELQDLIVNFDTFSGALAADSAKLSQTARLVGPTIDISHRSLVNLDRALPPLRRFSTALRPAVAELPATIAASEPWLSEASALLAPRSLGSIARDLRIATPGLAGASQNGLGALKELNLLSLCTNNTLVPTGNIVLNDRFSTGQPNSREFFYSTVNLAGESQSFDGNGSFLRLQPGGGPVRASASDAGGNLSTDKELWTNTIAAPIGTQPILGGLPPKQPDAPCAAQDIPDLNGPFGGVGPASPHGQ